MYVVRRVDVNRKNYGDDEQDSVQITRKGKLVEGFNPERITKVEVEEELVKWKNASHIHGWFVDNVQNGQDDKEWHLLSCRDIEKLLEVCEKVLNGSHLVREPAFKASGWKPIRQRMDTRGVPPMVMKNVSIAHKLLPLRLGRWDGPTDYGKQYLADVETIRDWAESTLMKEDRGELKGELYYRGH